MNDIYNQIKFSWINIQYSVVIITNIWYNKNLVIKSIITYYRILCLVWLKCWFNKMLRWIDISICYWFLQSFDDCMQFWFIYWFVLIVHNIQQINKISSNYFLPVTQKIPKKKFYAIFGYLIPSYIGLNVQNSCYYKHFNTHFCIHV